MESARVSNERLQKVLPDAIAAIHGVIEKHRVTEEEWSAVLAFLTEVGRQDEFILLSDVTKTSVLVDAISHEGETGVTPSDVEGPLYREDPPWREKPVKIYEEYEGAENGDVLFVHGQVTSADGTPISGAVLDIWQTGPDGGYDIWDERQPDYNFRGRFGVDEDGQLRVSDDAQTVHGPDGRTGGQAARSHRPAPVASGAHTFQGGGARTRAAHHAGLLPGRSVPGERHHRGGQTGPRQAADQARERGRTGAAQLRLRSTPASSTLR